MVLIQDGVVSFHRFHPPTRVSHCFFEWVYFANAASNLDGRSVYLARSALGRELAAQERAQNIVPLDKDTVIVPVPDTAKAAADAMAHELGLPCLEGLMRNRYVGRTFIEGQNRAERVQLKYTPVREVLEGKRVLLIEDTVVRSTTLKTLLHDLRARGLAREIHVRVACPPIMAPCFYGIDMSTVRELFAPRFIKGLIPTREEENAMARELGADSFRYLPVSSIASALDKPESSLCRACVTGEYPTETGERLYQLSLIHNNGGCSPGARTYEVAPSPVTP
jgi:amidophosphoribosyltransferase